MDYGRVMMALDKAPTGWPERLFLTEYSALDSERKKYYSPLYAKYRTKKIRDYDLDYGNFVGWKPIQVGVGEPVGYKYVGYVAATTIDRVMDSSVLVKRAISKPKKWNI